MKSNLDSVSDGDFNKNLNENDCVEPISKCYQAVFKHNSLDPYDATICALEDNVFELITDTIPPLEHVQIKSIPIMNYKIKKFKPIIRKHSQKVYSNSATGNVQGDTPFVQTFFPDKDGKLQSFLSLLDSGSSRSLMTLQFYFNYLIHLKLRPCNSTIKGIFSSDKCAGKVDVTFYVNNVRFVFEFLVINGDIDKVLLGSDFSSKFKIDILFSENLIRFLSGEKNEFQVPMHTYSKISISHPLICAISCTIPPHSESLIPTNFKSIQHKNLLDGTTGLVTPKELNRGTNHALISKCITNPYKDTIFVKCANLTNKPIMVPEKSHIADYNLDSLEECAFTELVNQSDTSYESIDCYLSEPDHANSTVNDQVVDLQSNYNDLAHQVAVDDLVHPAIKLSNFCDNFNGEHEQRLKRLLSKYRHCFHGKNDEGSLGAIRHFRHSIRLLPHAPCISRAKIYLLNPTREKLLIKKINEMIKRGVLAEIGPQEHTPWQTPVTILCKKDGTVSLICDFRFLNKYSYCVSGPCSHLNHTLYLVGNASIFSQLDATSGYSQLRLSPRSQLLATIAIPDGRRFKCLRGCTD